MRQEILEFLEASSSFASWEALEGDASTRRFWRLHLADAGTRILMEYPAPWKGPSLDAQLTTVFQESGLAVPAIYEVFPDLGCLILEDLGDRTLERELLQMGPAPVPPTILIEAATLAARIGVQGTPVLERSPRTEGPTLGRDRFRFEMGFFLEHYMGTYRALEASPALRQALMELADQAAETPRKVLCHRDFHSRNLMIAPDGRLTMVDIQDAQWGPDTYDLASLIHDAYVPIPENWRKILIASFATTARLDLSDAFGKRLQLVSAQRMIKALGTFGFQVAVRGQARFEGAIPRVLGSLGSLLPSRECTVGLGELLIEAGVLDPSHVAWREER